MLAAKFDPLPWAIRPFAAINSKACRLVESTPAGPTDRFVARVQCVEGNAAKQQPHGYVRSSAWVSDVSLTAVGASCVSV